MNVFNAIWDFIIYIIKFYFDGIIFILKSIGISNDYMGFSTAFISMLFVFIFIAILVRTFRIFKFTSTWFGIIIGTFFIVYMVEDSLINYMNGISDFSNSIAIAFIISLSMSAMIIGYAFSPQRRDADFLFFNDI